MFDARYIENASDPVERIEALSILMKSVCLDPGVGDIGDQLWQKNIFEIAKKNGITRREWETFRPLDSIVNKETYVFASRLADWAHRTG
jgi:hypothetical protein